MPPQVVLDTNVIVAALRSRNGASFEILSRVGQGAFDVHLSVPLVVEYEDAAMRQLGPAGLRADDVGAVLDYLCAVGRHQEIHFLWRPVLRDPRDEMVLEVAVAGECEAIVTHNGRDFSGAERFGIRVVTPGEFLRSLGGAR